MKTAGLLTFAEFEQLPEAPGIQELLDGELIELPPPKLRHMRISRRVLRLLQTAPINQEQVWFETGYRFSNGSWLQPDVSVSWPDQRVEDDYLIGSPMLAVEVASRGNTEDQLNRKVDRYLKEGAEEVWVVQPKTARMTVYRRNSVTPEIITGVYYCRIIDLKVSVPDLLAD